MFQRTIGTALAAGALFMGLAWGSTARAGTTRITVGSHRRIDATLITPDGPGPFPGVLVLHTSGGLQDADIAFAERLSKQGYVCLVPEFLAAYGISPQQRRATFTTFAEDIYDDFVAAAATLARHGKVAGGKIGAVGFSNGGYFAMWLAATGKVAAGVSFYGALSGAGSDIQLERFSQVFNGRSAPVLILHGTADVTVRVGAAERLAGIARQAGAPYELHLYEGADHRFDRDLADEAARATAEDAWQRARRFLDARLKGQ